MKCLIRPANYCADDKWECRANGLCHRERQPLGSAPPPSYLEHLGYPPINTLGNLGSKKRRVRLS